jgi:hypothetical protein
MRKPTKTKALRAMKIRTGRPRQWHEDMMARFSEGTFARMDAVRRPHEARTEFIREAVDRELKRRDKKRQSRQPTARKSHLEIDGAQKTPCP